MEWIKKGLKFIFSAGDFSIILQFYKLRFLARKRPTFPSRPTASLGGLDLII
jgi:hypothetical protein